MTIWKILSLLGSGISIFGVTIPHQFGKGGERIYKNEELARFGWVEKEIKGVCDGIDWRKKSWGWFKGKSCWVYLYECSKERGLNNKLGGCWLVMTRDRNFSYGFYRLNKGQGGRVKMFCGRLEGLNWKGGGETKEYENLKLQK